jgi:hypothetical protein
MSPRSTLYIYVYIITLISRSQQDSYNFPNITYTNATDQRSMTGGHTATVLIKEIYI